MPSKTPADGARQDVASDRSRLVHALEVLEEGPHPHRQPQVVGNLLLTSHAGLAILAFLVLLYLTGLEFTPLRGVHFALGFALIPILLVKLGSTGWRAVNYYRGRHPYRAAGPPWLLPRLMAVPLATCAVVATVSGVVLWSTGTDRGTWATIHTDSVVALGIIAVVHLAIYARRAFRASVSSWEGSEATQQERIMMWALIVALLAGAAAIGLEPVWHPSPNPPSRVAQQR